GRRRQGLPVQQLSEPVPHAARRSDGCPFPVPEPGPGAPRRDGAPAGVPGKAGAGRLEGVGRVHLGRNRGHPQLLRHRRREHLSHIPALPVDPRCLRREAVSQRAPARAGLAREIGRAALARVHRSLAHLACGMPQALIESLDREGRGVAHVEGKTIFVDGAVTGEEVEYAPYRKKPSFELAQLVRIGEESSSRVAPRCAFFGTCGGCSMQHVEGATQVAAKQRVLEDALWHVGRVRPETMLRPLHGLPWGYRHRARLSARWVEKKGGSLVGFRERKSTYVTDMTSCEVLPPAVSALISPLRALLNSLVLRERIPQIEVAVGDELTVLVLRVLEPVGENDGERLKRFADEHGAQIWLQPAGPDSARPFWPPDPPGLYYSLPQFGVRIDFAPTDFTQVNHAVNRLLVARALGLLNPRPGERIIDFFCGLGNFTLPIARS